MAHIECGNPKDLLQICAAFPNMSSLTLKTQQTEQSGVIKADTSSPSLNPLYLVSTCSRLGYLQIDQQQLQLHQQKRPLLDFSLLPESLFTLVMVDVLHDPSRLASIHLPLLTKLRIIRLNLSLPSMHSLLLKLPALEELDVEDQRSLHPLRRPSGRIGGVWGSSAHLTSVKLNVRGMSQNAPEELASKSLKFLQLGGEDFEADWLNRLFLGLPGLTTLSLSDCTIINQDNVVPGSLRMLRRVELLHCNAVHTLLEAVPFVSWSPKSGSSKASREADLSRIFSSKKLTHLSLADAPEVSVMPLDRFQQLKSLHLKDCSEMPLSVAQVEAMKELQKLTIEDSTPLDAEGYPLSLAGDKFGKNLIRSMAVHVMLSVRKLLPRGAYSGECALFKLGMA